MIKTPVVVKTEEGFDGRPIALLVQEASQYASKVYIQIGEKNINAKSIMGMMSLSLADGEKITVVTEGEDEGIFRNKCKITQGESIQPVYR